MDPSLYKDLKTSRGINYHYYFSPPAAGKPTILLLHGFPCTSYDWHRQVPFFKDHGYGVLVPDLLGYGGTDKPSHPAEYRMKLMGQDIIDIVEHEELRKVVSVGYDWGAAVNSRLATVHEERFGAFAFLAVGYMPPGVRYDVHAHNAHTEDNYGYASFGYWLFFDEDDAGKTVVDHIDSLFSLWFCADENYWKTDCAPIGKMKEWALADRKVEMVPYLSEEELNTIKRNALKGGFEGPTNWYKVFVRGYNNEDMNDVPLHQHDVETPVWFGSALKDYICLAPIMHQGTVDKCSNTTHVEFDCDHWIPYAQPLKLNEELFKWIEGLKL